MRIHASCSLALRALLLLAGIYVLSFGTALSINAGLGTSPISSLPAVVSLWRPRWTVGAVTIVLNALFVAAIPLLRRQRPRLEHALQFAVLFYFGPCIDLNLRLTQTAAACGYPVRLALTVAGAACVGWGVFAQTLSRLPMLPGDGLARAISDVFRLDFPNTKIGFDCSLVLSATLFSLVGMGGLHGIREGTFLAAVGVGLFVKLYAACLRRLRASARRAATPPCGAGTGG